MAANVIISSSVHSTSSVRIDHLACSYNWLIRTSSTYTLKWNQAILCTVKTCRYAAPLVNQQLILWKKSFSRKAWKKSKVESSVFLQLSVLKAVEGERPETVSICNSSALISFILHMIYIHNLQASSWSHIMTSSQFDWWLNWFNTALALQKSGTSPP